MRALHLTRPRRQQVWVEQRTERRRSESRRGSRKEMAPRQQQSLFSAWIHINSSSQFRPNSKSRSRRSSRPPASLCSTHLRASILQCPKTHPPPSNSFRNPLPVFSATAATFLFPPRSVRVPSPIETHISIARDHPHLFLTIDTRTHGSPQQTADHSTMPAPATACSFADGALRNIPAWAHQTAACSAAEIAVSNEYTDSGGTAPRRDPAHIFANC